jgi:hypothetical protein
MRRLWSLSPHLIDYRADIQGLFDKQIAGIMKKIDGQLNWMTRARPADQVVSLLVSCYFTLTALIRNSEISRPVWWTR